MSFIELITHQKTLGSRHKLPDFHIRSSAGYFTVGEEGSAIFLRLKKREAYPGTYCYAPDAETVVCGYGPTNPGVHDEFLQIVLRVDGSIYVKRDMYATLPLFYTAAKGRLVLGNDYRRVAEKSAPLTIYKSGVMHALIGDDECQRVMWEEIRLLDEREILAFENGKPTVTPPQPRAWQTSPEVQPTDPKDFNRRLQATLDAFTATRLDGQDFAYVVSGGLDSSLLPLYLARKEIGQKPRFMATLIFPGEFTHTQRNKLRLVGQAARLTGIEESLVLGVNHPLADELKTLSFHHFYCYEDPYKEPRKKLAARLAAEGVKVVVIGEGGDELFENILSPDQRLSVQGTPFIESGRTESLSYLTPQFKKDFSAVADESLRPPQILSTTLYLALVSENNAYIDYDIWPVTPFADPGLYEFCQGLPAHFRANKNILRAFYQAHGFPAEIYNPVHNEHYAHFFNDSLKSQPFQHAIQRYASDSITARMGYVDIQALLAMYKDCLASPNVLADQRLFYIFSWLKIEINLHLAP